MSRTMAEISSERAEARSKLSDLMGEAEGLSARSDSPGIAERRSRVAAGVERVRARIDALDEEHRDLIREIAQNPNNVETVDLPGSDRSDGGDRTAHLAPHVRAARDVGLRTIDRYRSYLTPAAGDRLDDLIRERDPQGVGARYVAAVGNPDYNTAFGKLLMDPQTGHLRLSAAEVEAVRRVSGVEAERAMSLTGASGGFAVPFTLDPSLMGTSNGSNNPFRAISRVVQIATDEWRGVSSGAITASYAAEATETTDNSPTLAQPTISTEKAQAFVPFSIEIGMDWGTIQQDLANLLAESKDDLEATKFTAGTGTAEPFGVLTGTTNTVNATTGQTVDAEDVYRLIEALPPRYRPRARFMGSDVIVNRLYRLVGGGSTEPPIVNEARTSILGRPYTENSAMGTTTATGVKFLLYGDFSRFVIVDRIGLNIELIPHLMGANRSPTGERGLYAYWRNSSKVVDANAFRALIGIA